MFVQLVHVFSCIRVRSDIVVSTTRDMSSPKRSLVSEARELLPNFTILDGGIGHILKEILEPTRVEEVDGTFLRAMVANVLDPEIVTQVGLRNISGLFSL